MLQNEKAKRMKEAGDGEESQGTDVYLRGNPFHDRKVVLSKELLDSRELSPVTVVHSSKMMDRFLEEVRDGSRRAAKCKTTLLLLVFCHGTRDYRILLDMGNMNKGLSITRLKEAIDPRCRVTMISTACYSGTWVLHDPRKPDHNPMNITMLSASKRTSNSWQVSNSMRRACGSVFVTSLIESLRSSLDTLPDDKSGDTSSPSAGCYSSTHNSDLDADASSLSTNKDVTFNAFCRSLLDTCRTRVHCLYKEQAFTFHIYDDQYSRSFAGESGMSSTLKDFAIRWEKLATVPYMGPEQDKLDMDPHPGNPSFREAGPSHPAGVEYMFDRMTKCIADDNIAEMADLFLQTCPGSWQEAWGTYLHCVLNAAVNGEENIDETDAGDLIRYRWEVAQLTDTLVRSLNIPVPSNKKCIFWDEKKWYGQQLARQATNSSTHLDLYSKLGSYLFDENFPPRPINSQGPTFDHATDYMAAAIVEENMSEEGSFELAKEAIRLMQGLTHDPKHIIQRRKEICIIENSHG